MRDTATMSLRRSVGVALQRVVKNHQGLLLAPSTINLQFTPCQHLSLSHVSESTGNSSVGQRPQSSPEVRATEAPLPFSEMPTPKALPVVGTLFDFMKAGAAKKIHEYVTKRHEELGPIYKEKMGAVEAVFISDPQYYREVHMQHGSYPQPLLPEAWRIYNEKYNVERGLFFMQGKEWYDTRIQMNKILLTPDAAGESAFTAYNTILTETLDRFGQIGKDGPIPDLEKEMYKWATEGILSVFFGNTYSGYGRVDETTQSKLIESIHNIFIESAAMTSIPPQMACSLNLPVWKRFKTACDDALYTASHIINFLLMDIGEEGPWSLEEDGLASKMREARVEDDMIYRILVDFILTAADTTSHMTLWAMHLLARNPEIQAAIYSDIQAIVPDGSPVTTKHIPKLRQVHWLLKEALRLYPIAPFITRIMPDKSIVGGYEIPAGTLALLSVFTSSRNSKYFPDPDTCSIQRWNRKINKPIDGFATLPFGQGVRSCIGKAIGEMEMRLFLARLVQKYEVKSLNEQEPELSMRLLLVPNEPILLQLCKRQ